MATVLITQCARRSHTSSQIRAVVHAAAGAFVAASAILTIELTG